MPFEAYADNGSRLFSMMILFCVNKGDYDDL